MANLQDFKKMTGARLKTVNILIKAGDWDAAAYMMGYVLEYGLKGMICSKLKLSKYPDDHKQGDISKYFRTHQFSPLLLISGLNDLFTTNGDKQAMQNWSDFTLEYLGEWPSMRYDPNRSWNETKVKKLYANLTSKPFGILTIIKKKW